MAAAAAGALLTWLIFVTVQQGPLVTRLGSLPLAVATWTAFAAGAWLAIGTGRRKAVPLILLGGIAIQLAALSAAPRGSDDFYRYLWDGRVQAAGIDPYQYVPAATALVPLRDPYLWPSRGTYCVTSGHVPDGVGVTGRAGAGLTPGCTQINRPGVPTIYPPVAEAYFAAVDEMSPPGSGSVPIQAAAAAFAVATTIVLLWGLRSLGRDPRLAVLWAWCPAVGLSAGNSAHVDAVAAFLAAAALLTLARDGRWRTAAAGGVLLGLAVAAKLTPALAAPAVLRRRPMTVALAAVGATAVVYLPHLLAVGGRVIGFLPGYLAQEGYINGQRFLLLTMVVPAGWASAAAVVLLAAAGLAVLIRAEPDQPWRGAVVMTGAAMAVTTPSFTWYSLMLVVLVAMDGRAEWLALAAAGYLTRHPLPHVTLTHASRIGYGSAVAVVVAVTLIRRYRTQPVKLPGAKQAFGRVLARRRNRADRSAAWADSTARWP
jgi:hypothetical protein